MARRDLILLAALLLLAAPSKADMFQDMSNITKPEAKGPAFTPPRYGNNFTANFQFESTYSNTHHAKIAPTAGPAFPAGSNAVDPGAQATVVIGNTSTGSGWNGLRAADIGLFAYSGHADYLTNTTTGEHDTIWAASFQGVYGDGGVLTSQAVKVYDPTIPVNPITGEPGGHGIGYLMEGKSNWLKPDGTRLSTVSMNVGFLVDNRWLGGPGMYGFHTSMKGGDSANQGSFLGGYAGLVVENHDEEQNCPNYCPSWNNVLVAVDGNVRQKASPDAPPYNLEPGNPNRVYFRVTGGITAAGDIVMGSGGQYAQNAILCRSDGTSPIDGSACTAGVLLAGNQTQSLGKQLTLQNATGVFRVMSDYKAATPEIPAYPGDPGHPADDTVDPPIAYKPPTPAHGIIPAKAEIPSYATLAVSQGVGPSLTLRSIANDTGLTAVPLNTGGSWRQAISATTGLFEFRANTAVAGDYSSQFTPLSLTYAGDVIAGRGSVLGAAATSGHLYIPTGVAPTGVPAYAAADRTAMVWVPSTKKLCVYNQATAAWTCSAAFTP